MVLIRLAHIAPMPTPAEIIKSLPEAPKDIPTTQTPTTESPVETPHSEAETVPAQTALLQMSPTDSPSETVFSNLEDIALGLEEAGEKILAAHLRRHRAPSQPFSWQTGSANRRRYNTR